MIILGVVAPHRKKPWNTFTNGRIFRSSTDIVRGVTSWMLPVTVEALTATVTVGDLRCWGTIIWMRAWNIFFDLAKGAHEKGLLSTDGAKLGTNCESTARVIANKEIGMNFVMLRKTPQHTYWKPAIYSFRLICYKFRTSFFVLQSDAQIVAFLRPKQTMIGKL
uniref:Uncharacterized protein n=1 Tax=Proboscia inermis TaxID=420281 RepID=A0A7S0BVW0_9STRA